MSHRPQFTKYERMSEATTYEKQSRRVSLTKLEYLDSVDELCQLQVHDLLIYSS